MRETMERIMRGVLHVLEFVIAIMTLVVMLYMLAIEAYKIITVTDYLKDAHTHLHNILTIVVGLEFVRMLLDMTPANTLEVLVVAISRQVIINHNDPWANVACVLCIAGLFAIRRYLIRRSELKEELVETE